ncbi:MAG: DUF4339 domain-containing protein, partial [Opitutaceae bacterium]|nr:DUF4339 domain-containing protein [Opitutaceae bacterium]
MSATQHEFYIRSASDDEAHGPFTFDQLARLAAHGQLAHDLLYYEAESEQWMPIDGNATLSARLFSISDATASPPPLAHPRADTHGAADAAIASAAAATSPSSIPPTAAASAAVALASRALAAASSNPGAPATTASPPEAAADPSKPAPNPTTSTPKNPNEPQTTSTNTPNTTQP